MSGTDRQPLRQETRQEAALARRSLRQGLRRLYPLLVISALYFAVLVYPILRIGLLTFPDWRPGTPVLLLIMVGPAAGRLAYEWLPGQITRWLAAATLTWLGTCFVAFTLLLPWELANVFLPLDGRSSGWALLLASAALTGWGMANAQRLTVRHLDVTAPEAAKGMRLAQISDVHVGSRSGRFLDRVVRRVNREQPDGVFITGDLVDFRGIQRDELAALGRLEAPAWFVIGNHERYVDLEAICERLRSLGVRVLRNESLESGALQIVGIDDAEPKTQVGRVLPFFEPLAERCRILLYHRPDGAADAAAWGAHLMLCGHTHNGQIVPFDHLVRRVFPRICGLYQVDGMTLYVSPGTGTWGPVMRLGSRCEVTMLHLR
ncbi:MAG: metallophosphoesterase [Anaerolineae bacterium]